MILNDLSFPYIRTQIPGFNALPPHIEYRSNSIVWMLRNFDDGNDYFYIEIFCGNAFDYYKIQDLVPPDIYQKILTDDKTFLYLVNSHEAFTDVVWNLRFLSSLLLCFLTLLFKLLHLLIECFIINVVGHHISLNATG